MTAFKILIGIVLSASVFSSKASAVGNYTLRSAVETALSKNPDVQGARERLTEARANYRFAVSQAFPTLNAVPAAYYKKNEVTSSSSAFGGDPYNLYDVQLKLVQPLYVGGAFWAGLNAAKKDDDIRKLDLQIIERDLTSSVFQSFYAVLANDRLLQTLRRTEAIQKESLATTEKRMRIGRSQLVDVLQVKTQIALLSPKISQADNQIKIAAAQLATLLGESQTNEMNLIGKLVPPDPRVINEKVKRAPPVLPEIQRNDLQLRQFDDKKDLQLAKHWPNLSLQAALGHTANVKTDLLNDYSTNWSVGLVLTIPLFSGLSSVYERQGLESQKAQLEHGGKKLFDQLALAQVQTSKDLELNQTVLQSSKQAAAYAKAFLAEAQKNFRLNTIDSLQLLTAEQNFFDAESAYIQAKYNYISSAAKYFAAYGLPLSDLMDTIERSPVSED